MSSLKSQFITLEGVEGAGKSTQKDALCRLLDVNGVPYIETREPGGTSYADDSPSAKTELLLMFAARAQHLETRILPALEAGTWVICDRFTDATYAYQGGGRELPVDWIETLETLVQGAKRPDLTLIFDVPIEIGLARAGRRGELDRIESEELAFFERVRAMYQQIASRETDRVVMLDASSDIESVTASMIALLMTRWNLSCHLG